MKYSGFSGLKRWLSVGILLILTFNPALRGQLSLQVRTGMISGSPIGPIPEGASGSPGLKFTGGLTIEYRITPQLGLRTGFFHAPKSSRYQAPVSGSQQAEASVFGVQIRLPFSFSYTGTVEGRFANQYWEWPLVAVWHQGDRLLPFAGLYFSKLRRAYHKGEVNVEVAGGLFAIVDEPFDESAQIRGWDWGLQAGADYFVWRDLFVSCQGQYGLISLFTQNPEGLAGKFRNLYLQLAVGYQFGR